jgi:Nucleotidyl transferase AbiEii toxin, Type IV TA system
VGVSGSRIFAYTLLMDIDNELKQTLERFLELCREFGVHPRLIGGLAVRGFVHRKRFTHDIDLTISRHDKPNLVALLKQMGFDYQDQSQFEGVKAVKHINNTTIELHISVDKLWDMVSNQTYTLSTASAEMPIDDAGELIAPIASVEDLLILKLLPLRDRDLSDVIALLLDGPEIDAHAFWANCARTGATDHIVGQLAKLEYALKSGRFREAWKDYYGEALSMHDILSVLEKLRTLLKAKR